MKKFVIAVLMSSLALPAAALEKIWGNPNWSGFWNLGAGGGYTESNFLASISEIDIDLGDDPIDDLDSPDGEVYAMPVVGFRYGYTFDNEKSHLFLANDRGDELQFERDLKLAFRYDFDHIGTMQAAYLTSSNLDTEVWSDPYLVGQQRTKTEQSSNGGRITWDRIFGSGFEFAATYRDREVDDERSGVSQGLTVAERQLLSREGDIIRAELGYLIQFSEGRHSFRPSVTFLDRNLDGDAMAQIGIGADLAYVFTARRLRWVNNIGYMYLDGDEENPIFGKTNNAHRFTASTQMFFRRFWGWKNWMPVVAASWGLENSDIDFNDTMTLTISATLYRDF